MNLKLILNFVEYSPRTTSCDSQRPLVRALGSSYDKQQVLQEKLLKYPSHPSLHGFIPTGTKWILFLLLDFSALLNTTILGIKDKPSVCHFGIKDSKMTTQLCQRLCYNPEQTVLSFLLSLSQQLRLQLL